MILFHILILLFLYFQLLLIMKKMILARIDFYYSFAVEKNEVCLKDYFSYI